MLIYNYITPVMRHDPSGNLSTFWKIVGAVTIVAAIIAISALTLGAGTVVMVGVGAGVSVLAQGATDLKNGEFSGINPYLTAALGGVISGLGVGNTILAASVVEVLLIGSIDSFNDALRVVIITGITAGLGYRIGKGISTKFAAVKLSKIMGPSSKNFVVNKNLTKHGFGYLKIGRGGLEMVARTFYNDAGYMTLQRTINSATNFAFNIII